MKLGNRVLLALIGTALCCDLALPSQVLGASIAQAGPQAGAAVDAAAVAVVPSVYWGAYIEHWPGDASALDDFDQITGKSPSIVAWGAPWWHGIRYVDFQSQAFDTVRSRGAIPMLSWGSWDYCCDADQPRFSLDSIIRGDHDLFLTNWARAARAWGHPFFLDFDSEMNGWWWPWSEQANGNTPGEFVAAWQHVVDLFRRVGATNVTWVWCPNIVEPLATPLDDLYPGDDYVDWTCMNGYNWGSVRGKWQEPDQVFGASAYRGESAAFNSDTYALLRKIAPTKPIMIGETAAPETGGSKAQWITRAYTQALPQYFPAIRAVVWFGWFDKGLDVDWSVATSDDAAAAFAGAISLPRYASNDYAGLTAAPISPPDGAFTGD
jgi:glycosyl hydrolase family 26